MKTLFSLMLLFIVSCTTTDYSETNDSSEKKEPIKDTIIIFDNFHLNNTLTHSLDEFSLTPEEKQMWIEKVKEHYIYYIENEWGVKTKPLIDNFTFLELNADGKPDLLFQGWSGAEANCVKIHFSSNAGFESPVEFYQNVKNIKIENGKIKSLTIVDQGCCAEYIEQEFTYTFDQEYKQELILHRARIGALADKYEILNSPIKFTIENETYKLRGEPIIDDTGTFVYDFYEKGNVVAIFKKGAQGRVWAKDKSDPEREWWYVEMDPIQVSLDFDMFSHHAKQGQLRRMGWMSSKFLKELK